MAQFKIFALFVVFAVLFQQGIEGGKDDDARWHTNMAGDAKGADLEGLADAADDKKGGKGEVVKKGKAKEFDNEGPSQPGTGTQKAKENEEGENKVVKEAAADVHPKGHGRKALDNLHIPKHQHNSEKKTESQSPKNGSSPKAKSSNAGTAAGGHHIHHGN